jgi:DMSO reductase family type II enzyme heme b subunit
MKRFFTHPLLLSALALAGCYVLFTQIITPPLPRSLLIQDMVIVAIAIVLVATFNNATAERFGAPIKSLLGNPKMAIPRFAALGVVVAGVAGLTYNQIKPSTDSPVELRTVHPAPPSSLKVYGKSFNLLKLTNPIRDANPKGSAGYVEAVKTGGELYYKNCIYCHGDLLDGTGHFAEAFNPRPINFQDVGTIAQLQEAFLFWRITTGGPGLPREGTPWASAMPVWHEMLKEDEVWKIITFLYDYTGHVPRTWELEKKDNKDGKTEEPAAARKARLDEAAIDKIYAKRCSHCHGDEGDGQGVAAGFVYPKPRDFTLATFKYKSTHADDEFPTDDDLRKTILEGLPGTSMPGWKSLLSAAEVDGLILKIKKFGEWDEEEVEHQNIDVSDQVKVSKESLENGRKLFVKACVQCHGDKGRGNITSGKKLKDDWQNRIWPRNLTRPETWRYTKTAKDVFQRLSTGIRGTPMPEHTTTMAAKDRWDVANYVMTLRENAVPLAKGETVVNGLRVEGDLPNDPDDPKWEKAPAMTFAMAPNIIKEPRVYFSLNDRATIRVLFNDSDVAVRVDIDDRTYSVPGDKLELAYRQKDINPTRDAVAVQWPREIPVTSEKPWFRHGDKKHAVNMWYWAAPSVEPKDDAQTMLLDAKGPDKAPAPRKDDTSLSAQGKWSDGQWRVVFKRSLKTDNPLDLQFEQGRYIPIAVGNWDGVAGEKGGRHSFTSWYWLKLEAKEDKVSLYGIPLGVGLFAGLIFLGLARQQRAGYAKNGKKPGDEEKAES